MSPCHWSSAATGSNRSNAGSTTTTSAAAESSRWRKEAERANLLRCCLGVGEGARCAVAKEEEGLREEWREGEGGGCHRREGDGGNEVAREGESEGADYLGNLTYVYILVVDIGK